MRIVTSATTFADLLVFEQSGPRLLRYLGSPLHRRVARDSTGPARRPASRDPLPTSLRRSTTDGRRRRGRHRARVADPDRRPRPFDASRPPGPRRYAEGSSDPRRQRRFKRRPCKATMRSSRPSIDAFRAAGWTDVFEIWAAVDLWGRSSDGARLIFEVKTLRPDTELGRVRAAVAQLLEYRFFYGAPDDHLCLVTDHPLTDRRVRFLAVSPSPSWWSSTAIACSQGRRTRGSEQTACFDAPSESEPVPSGVERRCQRGRPRRGLDAALDAGRRPLAGSRSQG